jgi:DNA-binding FadR family transcriptional regulator
MEYTFSSDPQTFAEADAEVHRALAAVTRNKLIIVIAEGLRKPIRTWIDAQSRSYYFEEGVRSHRQICDALAGRNSTLAREAMYVHMATARAALLIKTGSVPANQGGNKKKEEPHT